MKWIVRHLRDLTNLRKAFALSTISPSLKNLFIVLSPPLFVGLWSTGFIGARLSAPYADPLIFLSIRLTIAAILLTPIVFLLHQSFPKKISLILHAMVAGALLHAAYLGGVFYAVRHGFPIALSSLIAGFQPALASFIALIFLHEQLRRQQWGGLLLGFIGLLIVIYPSLQHADFGLHDNFGRSLLASIISLLGITLGTIYQKHFCRDIDLLPSAVLQFTAAAVITFVASFMLEDMRIEWNRQTIFAMAWLIFGLSIGAILILLYLIRQRAAAAVTSLFYLTPALVAIEGYIIFGEALSVAAIVGFCLSLAGVYLVTRKVS